MRTKTILPVAISTVAILSAAFGGALTKIQPPGGGVNTGAFLGPFIALIVLLIFSALSNKTKWYKILCIVLSVGTLIGFIFSTTAYFKYRGSHVVGYPANVPDHDFYTIGDSLSGYGKNRYAYIEKNDPPVTSEGLIKNSGGVPAIPKIWSDIENVNEQLNNKYLILTICLVISVFALTEGVVMQHNSTRVI